jgi:phosphoribosyl 1,2-cyclic phosphodiesterase
VLRVTVLGSGSRGNAVAVTRGNGNLLLDCGFSKKEIYKRLEIAGMGSDADLCLITHRHLDHSRSAESFNSVFFDACWERPARALNWMDCVITPFDLVHDVPCVGFRIDYGRVSIAYLVDFSEIPEESMKYLLGLDLVVIESNHEESMISPDDFGHPERHLSNRQMSCILQTINGENLKHVVLAHLSRRNNTQKFAEIAAREAVPRAEIIVAEQDYPTKTITIIK